MSNDLHHDDHEGSMARAELYRAAKYAMKLFEMIDENQELEGWVQSKITKSADYLDSVYHFMEYQVKFGGGDNAEDLEDITMDAKEKISNDVDDMEVTGDDEEMEMKIDENATYEEKLLALLEGRVDEKKKCKSKKMGEDEDVTEGDNIYHSCVKSFTHDKFGEGKVLHGEHTLAEDGTVTHYDATFVKEDGTPILVKNVPVANMKNCVIVEHGHPKKKKKVKKEEVVIKESQAQRIIRAMEERGISKEQLYRALTNEGPIDWIKGKVKDYQDNAKAEYEKEETLRKALEKAIARGAGDKRIVGMVYAKCLGDELGCLYSYASSKGYTNPEIDALAQELEVDSDYNMQGVDESMVKDVVKRVVAEKKQIDQNKDGKNNWEDVKIARMKAAAKAKKKDDKKETKESVELNRLKEFLTRLGA